MYDGMWSVLVCSGVVCDRACLYDILCLTLQAELNRIPKHIGWHKNVFVCGTLQVCKSV